MVAFCPAARSEEDADRGNSGPPRDPSRAGPPTCGWSCWPRTSRSLLPGMVGSVPGALGRQSSATSIPTNRILAAAAILTPGSTIVTLPIHVRRPPGASTRSPYLLKESGRSGHGQQSTAAKKDQMPPAGYTPVESGEDAVAGPEDLDAQASGIDRRGGDNPGATRGIPPPQSGGPWILTARSSATIIAPSSACRSSTAAAARLCRPCCTSRQSVPPASRRRRGASRHRRRCTGSPPPSTRSGW